MFLLDGFSGCTSFIHRKSVCLAFLVIILTGVLVASNNIDRAEASGTIYIRANGSVEGTTDIWTDDNNTYTFTDNIYDEIVLEMNNIVVEPNAATEIINGPHRAEEPEACST
jgi:hypothetical protein